jgi:hypothetical protein
LCKSPGGSDVCKPFRPLVLGVTRRGVSGVRVALYVRDFLGCENPQRLILANEIREDVIRYIAGDGKRARPLGSPRGMNEAVCGSRFRSI